MSGRGFIIFERANYTLPSKYSIIILLYDNYKKYVACYVIKIRISLSKLNNYYCLSNYAPNLLGHFFLPSYSI